MKFVAAHKRVHRDLAARNVLLSESFVCKITDFGLARDVYNGQYKINEGYKTSDATAYAWTSLEGHLKGVFTIESDVWSYAIVLSEICSLGNKPYVKHPSLAAVIDLLEAGGRMEKGRSWSQFLWSLMTRCWHTKPAQR